MSEGKGYLAISARPIERLVRDTSWLWSPLAARVHRIDHQRTDRLAELVRQQQQSRSQRLKEATRTKLRSNYGTLSQVTSMSKNFLESHRTPDVLQCKGWAGLATCLRCPSASPSTRGCLCRHNKYADFPSVTAIIHRGYRHAADPRNSGSCRQAARAPPFQGHCSCWLKAPSRNRTCASERYHSIRSAFRRNNFRGNRRLSGCHPLLRLQVFFPVGEAIKSVSPFAVELNPDFS